jgi:nitrogen-specific signal transduction histidine kinase
MKSFNTFYRDIYQMGKYIENNRIGEYDEILVQIFSGVVDETTVMSIMKELQELLPHAHIIGSTTSGEILNCDGFSYETVVSFSVFEHTKIRSAFFTKSGSDFALGQRLAEELITENTKVMILFGTALTINGGDMLAGVEKVGNDFVIAGGQAGNNGYFKGMFVFGCGQLTYAGAVGVSLNSDVLQVFNDYSLCWRGIGKTMTVTRSEKNRVYELDGFKAKVMYETYLGAEVADSLPVSTTEFPLLVEEEGIEVARCPVGVTPDGAVEFFGNVKEGSKAAFSYGIIDMVIQRSHEIFGSWRYMNLESVFIFSCAARRAFMQSRIKDELQFFRRSPVCGFFAYGEFFHTKNNRNILMNITTTILGLTENATRDNRSVPMQGEWLQNDFRPATFFKDNFIIGKKTTVVSVLNNLIDAVLKDLALSNEVLESNNNQLRIYAQALQEKQEAMIEREKAASLGHLMAGIAHNLKTPLLTSSGGLSLLSKLIKKLEENPDQDKTEIIREMKEWTAEIKESLDYISEIIGTVNGYVVNPAPTGREFSIDELVKKIKILMVHELRRAKCRLDIDNAVDSNVRILGNINDLVQVMNVLIGNSIDSYKGEGGDIRVNIVQVEDEVQMEVIDYGSGISKEISDKLFREMVTNKGKNGTGLGLYTSYSIILGRFFGNISFRSAENRGTTFRITLPIKHN